jgi:hypothetical protein
LGFFVIIWRGRQRCFIVDNSGDLVAADDGGTDTVRTSLARYTLLDSGNIENLVYTGSGNSKDKVALSAAANGYSYTLSRSGDDLIVSLHNASPCKSSQQETRVERGFLVVSGKGGAVTFFN